MEGKPSSSLPASTYGHVVRLEPNQSARLERLGSVGQACLGLVLAFSPLVMQAWEGSLFFFVPWLLSLAGAVVAVLSLRRFLDLDGMGATEASLHPGGSIDQACHLSIRHSPRRTMTVSLHASVVLRETIRGGDFDKELEHMAVWFEEGGVQLTTGESIFRDYPFVLPEADPVLFQPGRGELSWIFKLRLRSSGVDVWDEFWLPLPVARPAPAAPSPLETSREYAVVLVERKLTRIVAIKEALSAIHPFLDSGQLSEMVSWTPKRVLLSASRIEVEMARRRLEAAGAVVEVRLGDQVIPRQLPHDLPLAADGASLPVAGAIADLPRIDAELPP